MRHVLAVARHKTLFAAARDLGVKRCTVLRRIDGLEMRVCVRLFERTPGAYVMTSASSGVLGPAEVIEDSVFDIERRIRGRDREPAGELRVTMADVFARQIAPALARFSWLHLGSLVDALVSVEPFNLAERQADIAIRVSAAPEPYLTSRKILDLPFAV